MTKKIFAILMSAMMMLTFMPAMAFADVEYVAKIGATSYETLAKAVEKVEAGQTIELVKNITGGASLEKANTSFTVDGSEATTTGTVTHQIEGDVTLGDGVALKNVKVNGNVTINDKKNASLDNDEISGKVEITSSRDVNVKDTKSSSFSVVKSDVVFSGKIAGGIGVEDNSDVDLRNITEYPNAVSVKGTTSLVLLNAEEWSDVPAGECSHVYQKDAVCVYDGQGYKSVAAAVGAIDEKATTASIKLVADSTENSTITIREGLVVEFNDNGYKFDGAFVKTESTSASKTDGTVVISSGKFKKGAMTIEKLAGFFITDDLAVVEIDGYNVVGIANIKATLEKAETTPVVVKWGQDIKEALKEVAAAVASGKKLEVALGVVTGMVFDDNYTLTLTTGEEYTMLDDGRYAVLTADKKAQYDKECAEAKAFFKDEIPTYKVSEVTTNSLKLTFGFDGVVDGYELDGDIVNGNTVTLTDLAVGSCNQYKLKAFKLVLGKYRVYSDEVDVDADTKPAKVNKPTVKAAVKAVKVNYKKTAGAGQYQISVSTKKAGTSVKFTGTAKTKTIKKLKAKKTYYVKVRALSKTGVKGAWSTVVKVKTR